MTSRTQSPTKYLQLDTRIEKAIRDAEHATFTQLVTKLSLELQPYVSSDKDSPDRVLDRRLQALRRGERIEHHGGYWWINNFQGAKP